VLAVHDIATGWGCGVMPVPLTGIVRTVAPLLDMVNDPLTAPAVVGENVIWTFMLCPAPMLKGEERPVLSPVPVRLSWVTLTVAFPGLVTFTVWLVERFRGRSPKETLPGVAVREPAPGAGVGVGVGVGPPGGVGVVELSEPPEQPESKPAQRIRTSKPPKLPYLITCVMCDKAPVKGELDLSAFGML